MLKISYKFQINVGDQEFGPGSWVTTLSDNPLCLSSGTAAADLAVTTKFHSDAAEFAFQSKEPKTRAEFDTVLLSVLYMIE